MDIKLNNIHKAFGKNEVLKGVDFHLKQGEIHALIGENGAGKSTLMNILTGLLKPDKGEILIDGKKVEFKNINDANDYGIRIIHQELSDFPEMNVAENIFLNREIKKGIFLDKKRMIAESKKLFADLNIDLDPEVRVADLSVGMRQMMEIAKANLGNLKVLILDEPTTALTNREIEGLFKLMGLLRKKDVSMIYISHRMEEIFALSDSITIMRDGVSVKTCKSDEIDEKETVSYMVGRKIEDFYPEVEKQIGDELLEIRNFTKKGVFSDINMKVHRGEILGIAGLMGAGRSEIMRCLFGIDKKDEGEIRIDGKVVAINSPADAKREKIAFITENRKEEGLLIDLSIRENISIPNLKSITNNFIVDKKQECKNAKLLSEKLRVKSQSIEDVISDLSGGNQQKVVMAKWLGIDPEILILDEPTKGVDVAAKREIYLLINEMAKRGVAIIMISSDLPELISLSDRVYVIYEGKLQGELEKDEIDSEKVMTLATGGRL